MSDKSSYWLRKLKISATTTAKFRGHKMSRWKLLREHIQESTCKKCKMTMRVNTAPLPNEVDIGGEAVALNCVPGI